MEIKKPDSIGMSFVYACMGFGHSNPDEASKALVEKCQNLVLAASKPSAVYQVFDLKRIYEGDGVTGKEGLYIGNKNFPLEGEAISQHLRGCEKCALMAVTLGVQVDKLIRRTQLTDMAEAVAMDACASSLTEDICNQVNGRLEMELAEQGSGTIGRFSPGYGDLPLKTQDVFDKLLEMNKKIGLTQSKEHLLLPRKSVTALIGILPLEEWNRKYNSNGEFTEFDDSSEACEVCERKKECSFKKSGGFCGRTRT